MQFARVFASIYIYKRFRTLGRLSKTNIENMQQRIFICLFSILFLIVSNHGGRLVAVNDDEGSSKHERGRMFKTRKTIEDENSIQESVGQSLVRRHFFHSNGLFQRRQASGFTTAQRQYQQSALQAHNRYRARHCAPPLQLDDDISRSAHNYAEYLADIDQMVHSRTSGLGENLYMQWSSAGISTIDGE